MAFREEMDEKQRVEEERRERLEALPPEYVIHIVHGTFARKATWIEPDSNFSTGLRNSLDWRAKIEPFRWTGGNGAVARWRAAQKLERRLRESVLTIYPYAHHVVVAHSHGGNIALWAIGDPLLASKILGVATLSTPFLSARVRPSKEHLIDFGTALFAGFFIFLAVLFFSVFRGLGFRLWPWAAGIGLALLAAIAGGVASGWMRKYAARICDRMPATFLGSEQVAILRVEGDEATAAITGVRLAGALGDLLWRILSAPVYKYLEGLLTAFDYGWVRWVRSARERDIAAANQRRAAWSALLAEAKESDRKEQLSLSLSRDPPPPLGELPPSLLSLDAKDSASWTTLLRHIVAANLPILVVYLVQEGGPIGRQVALAGLLIYGIPAALAVATVVLGLPFGVLSSITLLPCGWTLPFAGPFLQLVAEPCPPGSWKVTQFEAREGQSGLLHSEAYQRDDVSNYIAGWIKDRRKTFEARA